MRQGIWQGSWQRASRGLLSALVIMSSLLLPSGPLQAAAQPQPAPPTAPTAADPAAIPVDDTVEPVDELLARVDGVQRVLARLQRDLDPRETNVAALAFALDGDADAAVDWVRAQIAFEQYPGLLRGAHGALLGRAANALDTALLLAAILNDAGYDVRIARGALAPDDAAALVDQIMLPRPTPATYADDATLRRLLVDLGMAMGLDRQAAEEVLAQAAEPTPADPWIAQSQADAQFIQTALQTAAVDLGDPAAVANLVQEATDYFWVEYRLSAGHRWVAAHPAFKDPAAVPTGLRATQRFTGQIPPDLQHRLRVQVEIEQKVDDRLVTQTVTPRWEWLVADLVGKPLVFRNNLMGLGELDGLASLPQLLGETAIWVPTLNGQLLTDGLAFDLNGVTYDPAIVGNDIFRVSQQITSALEDALGALDALDEEGAVVDTVADDRVTLTGQTIVYTLIAPGGAEHTVRRTVLDRVGAELRAAGTVAIAPDQAFPQAAALLLTQYTIHVLPAEYSPAYVTTRYLQLLKQEVDLLDYVRAQLPLGEAMLTPPLRLLEERQTFDDVLLNTLFAQVPLRTATQTSYRAAPYLVVLEDGLRLDDDAAPGQLRVDVIQNTRRAWRWADGDLQADPAANIAAGAWETHAEGSPLAAVQGTRFSTLVAFDAAASARATARVLTADDPAVWAELDLPRLSQEAMQRDLAAGYVVILPAEVDPATPVGWWRVHPRSGETLGLAEDGRGASGVEYSFLNAFVENLILGAPSTLLGYGMCMAGASGSAGCCAADAAVTYFGFAALGAGVAKWSAVAAILIGEGTKIGGIVGGATGKAPSFCN